MKKLFLLFLVVCMVFSIAACTPTPEHTHKESVWMKDATNHRKECRDSSCKEVLIDEPHTFEETRVIREPSPTMIGKTEITCSVCGYKTEKDVPYVPNPEVTETEWDNAVVIKGDYVFQLTYKLTNSEGEETVRSQETVISGSSVSIAEVIIYTIDNGNFYKFTIDRTDIGGGWYVAKTYRQTTTQQEMLANSDTCSYLAGQFSSFSFDSENSVYTCESLVVSGTTLTNVKLTFADGVLVKYSYDMVTEAGYYNVEYTYTYESRQIFIPVEFIDLDQAIDQGGEGGSQEGGSQEGGEQNNGSEEGAN